uniref:Protein AHNAK2 n=1 Tax=Malurus cyaneus samueli TaxID=2593467 RepID=A0A8C5TWF5_9PASS
MPKADIKAPKVDISLPSVDVTLPQASVDLQAPEAALGLEGEVKGPEKEAAKTKDGKFKMPKFGMPSFGWSSSREAKGTVASEVDVSLKEPQVTVPSAAAEVDVSLPAAEIQVPGVEVTVETGAVAAPDVDLKAPTVEGKLEMEGTGLKGKLKMPKFDKPKFALSSPKVEAPSAEVSLPSAEVELPSATVTASGEGPTLGLKADIPGAKTEGAGWKLEKPSLKMPKADIKAPKAGISLPSVDVTLPQANVDLQAPEAALSLEGEVKGPEKEAAKTKDGKFKMPKFGMPSFGWSSSREAKGTVASEVDVSLKEPQVTVPSAAAEVDVSLPAAEIQVPGVEVTVETGAVAAEGEKGRFKMPDVKMPSVKLPKVKGPHAQVSLPKADISLPKGQEGEVALQGPEAEASLDVAAGKAEGGGMKIHMPKVKVPSVVFSKPTVKAPKLDVDVSLPQAELKAGDADVTIAAPDIKLPSVEGSLELQAPDVDLKAPTVEGKLEMEGTGLKGKLKMPKFDKPKFALSSPKVEAPSAEVSLPSAEVELPSLLKPSSEVALGAPTLDPNLAPVDVTLPKLEKEGHFKMPKFKLPSFNWSPKKEASVKSDSGANLEEQNLAVTSSRIDTEVKGTATDEQGSGPDLDLEISAGKVEQKSPIKKPQFVMPKISLSKIKVPKSHSHSPKVEADATLLKTDIEGDDSIKIPDIEKSHSEGTEEGAQISIKLADTKVHTLEFSRIETEASKTEMTVGSAKIDASLTPSEGSFQQVDFKVSSTNECNIQKTGIKLPKGEASVDLKSPDILTESSSVVDGRKMKLEGPEGKVKMPKFQKPKFGISLTKGKGPETEISSPKIEAELPQLKMTDEIADIAVGVPASELASDMSDPGVVDSKIKTPQALIGGIEVAKVDISTHSVSKPKTEGVTKSLEEKEIKLKEHEIKAEEVQTEEYQGWFKMPKFRIPGFSKSSIKEKKSDAGIERRTEKAQATIPAAKVQTETSITENTFSLPHALAEITVGKEGIQKLGDSVKSSDVSLPKIEGDISLSTESSDSRVNIPKTETYADVVKRSAEGHTSEITMSAAELSKSYPSASESDKDNSSTERFPTCTLTFPEHEVKSQDTEVPKAESSMKLETSGVRCKPSSAEITLDATQKKIDVSLPNEELDIQNKETAIKKGKIKGDVKFMGKDSGESQFKRTTCEWSTSEGSEDEENVFLIF